MKTTCKAIFLMFFIVFSIQCAGHSYFYEIQDDIILEKNVIPLIDNTERYVCTKHIKRRSSSSIKYEDVESYEKARDKKDGRFEVSEKQRKKTPYCFQGYINAFYDKGHSSKGSGILVGPRHVLTAGHIAWSHEDGKFAKKIKFIPACNNEKTGGPFGIAQAVRVYTFGEWDENIKKNYDLSLIILDQPIGEKTGWAGMKVYKNYTILEDRKFTITGYPSDKKGMQTMRGPLKEVKKQSLHYNKIDTYGGQSGSGILNEYNYVVGIHTRGDQLGKEKVLNSGVLLTEEKLKKIVGWIARSWEVKPSTVSVSPILSENVSTVRRIMEKELSGKTQKEKIRIVSPEVDVGTNTTNIYKGILNGTRGDSSPRKCIKNYLKWKKEN